MISKTTCGAIPLERLAGEEQGRARDRCVDEPGAADHGIELLYRRIANRQLCVDDIVDRELVLRGSAFQLTLRPLGPQGIIRNDIHKDVRIDKDQSASPRVRAISSSVVMPSLALPRRRAKRLSVTC